MDVECYFACDTIGGLITIGRDTRTIVVGENVVLERTYVDSALVVGAMLLLGIVIVVVVVVVIMEKMLLVLGHQKLHWRRRGMWRIVG